MAEMVLLRNMLECGDVTYNHYINFVPNAKEISLDFLMTGIEDIQYVRSHKHLGWHPFYYTPTNEIFLIADGVDDSMILWLRGNNGLKNAKCAIKLCSELYCNKELHAQGIPFTRKIYSALPEEAREVSLPFWLADEYEEDGESGIWRATSDKTYKTVMIDKNGNERDFFSYIRPIVVLPKNVLVSRAEAYYDGKSKMAALSIMRE